MEFELLTVGDAVFVSRILNGTAMMANAGTFQALAAIGFLVGLFAVAIKGIQSQKLDMGGWAAGLVVYMVMFWPTADVLVMDATPSMGRDTEVEIRVDNVPVGVAAMGWVVSSVSSALRERMLMAFSAPGLSEGLQGSDGSTTRAIETIAGLRQLSDPEKQPLLWDRNSELRTLMMNLEAFIRRCSDMEMTSNSPRLATFMNSPDPMNPVTGLGSNDQWIGVDQWEIDASVTPADIRMVPKSCADASTDIRAALNSPSLVEGVKKAMGPMMALDSGDFDSTWATASALLARAASEGYAGDSVLGGTVAQSMQRYVVAHVVGGALKKTVASGGGNQMMALNIVLGDAIAQRNTQWVAEESLFLQMARPISAFFESMVYVCAPFMAFALGLGSFGLSLTMRYGLLTLWVMLWGPTMAAINLFQVTMAESAFKATAKGTGEVVDLGSLAGSVQIMEDAESWIAIGSMLMAATPAITLMLLFGSAMTAVGLANRLQSADTINEKNASPDAVSTGAGVAQQSAYTGNMETGATRTGWTPPKFDLASAVNSSRSAAQTDTLAASQSYAAGSERASVMALQRDTANGFEARNANELISAFSGTRAAKEAMRNEEGGGVRNANEASIAAMAAWMIRGGGGAEVGGTVAKMLSLSAGTSGEVSSREELGQRTQAVMEAAKRIAAISENDAGLRAELQQRGTQAVAGVGRDMTTNSARVASQDGFKQEARDLAESSKRYEALNSASQSLATRQDPDLRAVATGIDALTKPQAQALANAMGVGDKVNWDAPGTPGQNALRAAAAEFVGGDWAGQARQMAGALQDRMPGNANTGAMLMLLAGQGGREGYADERANALVAALGASGTSLGVSSAPAHPSEAPSGMPNYGDATAQVKQNAPPIGQTTANAEQTTAAPPSEAVAANGAGVDLNAVNSAGDTARRATSTEAGSMVPSKAAFDQVAGDSLQPDREQNKDSVRNDVAPGAVLQNLSQALSGIGAGDTTSWFGAFNPSEQAKQISEGEVPTSPVMSVLARTGSSAVERGGGQAMPGYEDIKGALMSGSYPGVQEQVPEPIASVVAAGIAAAKEAANPSGPEMDLPASDPRVLEMGISGEAPRMAISSFNQEQAADIRENAAQLSPAEMLVAQGVLSQVKDGGDVAAAGLNLLNNSNLPDEAQQQVVEGFEAQTGEKALVWRPPN